MPYHPRLRHAPAGQKPRLRSTSLLGSAHPAIHDALDTGINLEPRQVPFTGPPMIVPHNAGVKAASHVKVPGSRLKAKVAARLGAQTGARRLMDQKQVSGLLGQLEARNAIQRRMLGIEDDNSFMEDAPATTRLGMLQRLGQRNLASLTGEIGDLGPMPAAAAHRAAQATTAAHAAGMNYTGGAAAEPSLQTRLGLARVPTIQGGNVEDVAYTGAPGTTPFVSDGPLSEHRTQPRVRGAELQGKIDRMKRRYGISQGQADRAPARQAGGGIIGGIGPILYPPATLPGGSEMQAMDHGGIRVVGSDPRRDAIGQLIGPKVAVMQQGIPTTIGEATGEVVDRGPSLPLRLNRFRQMQSRQRGLPFEPDRSVPEMVEMQRNPRPATRIGEGPVADSDKSPAERYRKRLLESELDTTEPTDFQAAEEQAQTNASTILDQIERGDVTPEEGLAMAEGLKTPEGVSVVEILMEMLRNRQRRDERLSPGGMMERFDKSSPNYEPFPMGAL